MNRPLGGRSLAVALLLVLGLSGAAAAADYRSTADNVAVLYDAPSTRAKRLFVLGRNYPLEVMVSLESWTKVRDAGGSIGWVESRTLGARRMVVVKPAVAEVRASAEETAAIAFKVAQGVLLEWVETLPSGWTRVRHADAGTGFIRTADIWGA